MNRNSVNLSKHELIGLSAKVSSADCSTFVGIEGKVIDETKNTLKLRTINGTKTVPKKGKTFTFNIEDEQSTVLGDAIVARPQDRTKTR